MNIQFLSSFGFLLFFLDPCTTWGQDHLEPEVSIMYAATTSYEYCQNVNVLFFAKTPSDYLARMFCRPGFNKPQWCVTIYKDKAKNCTVEYVEAGTQVDHSKDSLKIKVKQAIQPIDLVTAQMVEAVFRRMLRGVHYSEQKEDGGDSDEFTFSRNVLRWGAFDQQPGDASGGSEQGVIHGPDKGSLTEKLVTIGEALKRYATADSPEKRDSIRSEIRLQAKELESRAALVPAPR